MKNVIALFFVIFSTQLFSQDIQDFTAFSKFSFSLLGGTNFSNNSSLGASLQIEVKTVVLKNTTLKASVGFSLINEDKEYLIRSFHPIRIEDYEGYQLNTYSINQIQYSVVPINLGLEYVIYDNDFSPFGIFEVGYNFYSGEEQVLKGGSGEYFDNIDEVPAEYHNAAPGTFDGSSFGIGFGLGLKYQISSSMNINIRYMYRYHDSIINVNQILLGVTF